MFLTIITLYFWLFFHVRTMLGALVNKFIYFFSDVNHHLLQLLSRVSVNQFQIGPRAPAIVEVPRAELLCLLRGS